MSLRLTTLGELLEFLHVHGHPTQADGADIAIGFSGSVPDRTAVAYFNDGWRLVVCTDYEADYSDLTPGDGASIWWLAYAPDETLPHRVRLTPSR